MSRRLAVGLLAVWMAAGTHVHAADPAPGKVLSVVPDGATRYRDHADVISVQPLRRVVRIATPERRCYDETVYDSHGHDHYYGHSPTAPIVGGIVGGLVGNQFGRGDGRALATIAGVVLGASIGNDYRHRHHHHFGHGGYYTRQRCETVYRDEVRDDGYVVEYRYRGQVYTARVDRPPVGDRIEVDVEVLKP